MKAGTCVFAGLEQLLVEKNKADQIMAELLKARAREDADFAAAQAAAAAQEWEQVYALRVEREEADTRAAEAKEKLRKVEAEASARLEQTQQQHFLCRSVKPFAELCLPV